MYGIIPFLSIIMKYSVCVVMVNNFNELDEKVSSIRVAQLESMTHI
jgi:hypothetical protein